MIKKFNEYINESIESKNEIEDLFLELKDDYGYVIEQIEKGYYTDNEFSKYYPSEGEEDSYEAYEIKVKFADSNKNFFKSIDESPFYIIPNFLKQKNLEYDTKINFNSDISSNRYMGTRNDGFCIIVLIDKSKKLDPIEIEKLNTLKEDIKEITYNNDESFIEIKNHYPINHWTYLKIEDGSVFLVISEEDFNSEYNGYDFKEEVDKICKIYNSSNTHKLTYEIVKGRKIYEDLVQAKFKLT